MYPQVMKNTEQVHLIAHENLSQKKLLHYSSIILSNVNHRFLRVSSQFMGIIHEYNLTSNVANDYHSHY